MRRSVLDVYHDIFSSLEHDHILYPDNDVDIFCLHEVFTPRINKSLTEFVSSWHNHPMSSERNMAPFQLFHVGIIDDQETSDRGGKFLQLSQLCQTLRNACGSAGGDVYRRVTAVVGQHLTSNCASCSYE